MCWSGRRLCSSDKVEICDEIALSPPLAIGVVVVNVVVDIVVVIGRHLGKTDMAYGLCLEPERLLSNHLSMY
jgi:hypothetical protein